MPHIAGTAGDYDSALSVLDKFQSYLGISKPEQVPVYDAGSHESRQATLGIPRLKKATAWIDTYYPMLNYPVEQKMDIVEDDGTSVWSADLSEPILEGDPASHHAKEVRPFHGFSASGTAQVRSFCHQEDPSLIESRLEGQSDLR